MRLRTKSAGRIAAGVFGTIAAAATVAAAIQHHRIGEVRRKAVDVADELPTPLPPNREYTVWADDGVALSVEELDPADGGTAELTAVLIHGYTLDRRAWLFQRHELAHSTAPRVRQVLYDHRSHGRSGRSPRAACTIEQLGRDLHAVIQEAAPEGRVVLIGHSLGGMTIMALAEHYPELFAERICGVAFLNTSAGDIGRSGLPKPILSRRNVLMPVAKQLARWEPSARAIDCGREAARNLIWGFTRSLSFGDEAVHPALVELLYMMIRATSFEVMTDFLEEFGRHNRYAALDGLQHVKVLVLGTGGDRMIQYQHSEAIAALLPQAELVQIPGSGHVMMLEQPKLVNEHLIDLLSQCAGAATSREKTA
jgi:pimeloyl-ACP methyl ester carboxylesterase